MTIKCKRCGQCCENMALEFTPKELETCFDQWKKSEPQFHKLTDIHLVYPMLRFIRYDKKINRYRYRCVHLSIDKTGKACCDIHKHKPDVCKSYGSPNRTLTMGIAVRVNKDFYPKCVF